MMHETTASDPRFLSLQHAPTSSVGGALRPSVEGAMDSFALRFLRRGSVEHLETLFSRLKGGALLIAALSYGLELTTNEICSIRVRDIHIASQSMMIRMREYRIPKMVLDDLREYLQDKLCGYEASTSLSKRESLLFSEAERLALHREVASWWQIFKLTQQHAYDTTGQQSVQGSRDASVVGVSVCLKPFDKALCLLGRSHRYQAVRRKIKVSSALELFDKGPRIVRRTRSGAVASYYVWRTQAPSLLPISKM